MSHLLYIRSAAAHAQGIRPAQQPRWQQHDLLCIGRTNGASPTNTLLRFRWTGLALEIQATPFSLTEPVSCMATDTWGRVYLSFQRNNKYHLASLYDSLFFGLLLNDYGAIATKPALPWTGLFGLSPDNTLYLGVNGVITQGVTVKNLTSRIYRSHAFSSDQDELDVSQIGHLEEVFLHSSTSSAPRKLASFQFASHRKLLLHCEGDNQSYQTDLDETLHDRSAYFRLPYWKQKLFQVFPNYYPGRLDPAQKNVMSLLGHYLRKEKPVYETTLQAIATTSGGSGAIKNLTWVSEESTTDTRHPLGGHSYAFFMSDQSGLYDELQGPDFFRKVAGVVYPGISMRITAFNRSRIPRDNELDLFEADRFQKAQGFSFPHKDERFGHRYLTFYVNRTPTPINRLDLFCYGAAFDPTQSPLFDFPSWYWVFFPEKKDVETAPFVIEYADLPNDFKVLTTLRGRYDALSNPSTEAQHRIRFEGFQVKARYIRIRLAAEDRFLDLEGKASFWAPQRSPLNNAPPEVQGKLSQSMMYLGRASLDTQRLMKIHSVFAPRFVKSTGLAETNPNPRGTIPLVVRLQCPPPAGEAKLVVTYHHQTLTHTPSQHQRSETVLLRGGEYKLKLAVTRVGYYRIKVDIQHRASSLDDFVSCDQQTIQSCALANIAFVSDETSPLPALQPGEALFINTHKAFKWESLNGTKPTQDTPLQVQGAPTGAAFLTQSFRFNVKSGKDDYVLGQTTLLDLYSSNPQRTLPEGYYAVSVGIVGDQSRVHCSMMANHAYKFTQGGPAQMPSNWQYLKALGFSSDIVGKQMYGMSRWWETNTAPLDAKRAIAPRVGERFIGVYNLTRSDIVKNAAEFRQRQGWFSNTIRFIYLRLRIHQGASAEIAYVRVQRLSEATFDQAHTILPLAPKAIDATGTLTEASNNFQGQLDHEAGLAQQYERTLRYAHQEERGWIGEGKAREENTPTTNSLTAAYSDKLLRMNYDGYSYSEPYEENAPKVREEDKQRSGTPFHLAQLYDKEDLYNQQRNRTLNPRDQRLVDPARDIDLEQLRDFMGMRMQVVESLELDLGATYGHITDLRRDLNEPMHLIGSGYVYGTKLPSTNAPETPIALVSPHQALKTAGSGYCYLEVYNEASWTQLQGFEVRVLDIQKPASDRYELKLVLRNRGTTYSTTETLTIQLFSPINTGYYYHERRHNSNGTFTYTDDQNQSQNSALTIRAWVFPPDAGQTLDHVIYWRAMPYEVLDQKRWFLHIPLENDVAPINPDHPLGCDECEKIDKKDPAKVAAAITKDPFCGLGKCELTYPKNFTQFDQAKLSPFGKSEREAEFFRREDYFQALGFMYLHERFKERSSSLFQDLAATDPLFTPRLSLRLGQVSSLTYDNNKVQGQSLIEGLATYITSPFFWRNQSLRQRNAATTFASPGASLSYASLAHQDHIISFLCIAVRQGIRAINLDFTRDPSFIGNFDPAFVQVMQQGLFPNAYLNEGDYAFDPETVFGTGQQVFGSLFVPGPLPPGGLFPPPLGLVRTGQDKRQAKNNEVLRQQRDRYKQEIITRFLMRLWKALLDEQVSTGQNSEKVSLTITLSYDPAQNEQSLHLALPRLQDIRDALQQRQQQNPSSTEPAIIHADGFVEDITPWHINKNYRFDPYQMRLLYEQNLALSPLRPQNSPITGQKILHRIRPATESLDRNPFTGESMKPLVLSNQMWQRRLYAFLKAGGDGFSAFTITTKGFVDRLFPEDRRLFLLSSRVGLECWQQIEAPCYDWWTTLS